MIGSLNVDIAVNYSLLSYSVGTDPCALNMLIRCQWHNIGKNPHTRDLQNSARAFFTNFSPTFTHKTQET